MGSFCRTGLSPKSFGLGLQGHPRAYCRAVPSYPEAHSVNVSRRSRIQCLNLQHILSSEVSDLFHPAQLNLNCGQQLLPPAQTGKLKVLGGLSLPVRHIPGSQVPSPPFLLTEKLKYLALFRLTSTSVPLVTPHPSSLPLLQTLQQGSSAPKASGVPPPTPWGEATLESPW